MDGLNKRLSALKTASACRRNCAISHFNWTSWFGKIPPSLIRIGGWDCLARKSHKLPNRFSPFHPITSHRHSAPSWLPAEAASCRTPNIQTPAPPMVCFCHCGLHYDGNVLQVMQHRYCFHIKGHSNFTLDRSHRTHSHTFHLGHVWETLRRLLGELENWQNWHFFFLPWTQLGSSNITQFMFQL